jgi:hypothetical protein
MGNQFVITTNIVLSGLSGFIPVPFLDDVVAAYFNRRMVSDLANKHNLKLSSEEISILATGQGDGCLKTIVYYVINYPIKKIIKWLAKELFFGIQIQQAANVITHTYYHGILLDYVFSNNLYQPGNLDEAKRLSIAIDRAHFGANRELFQKTIINVLAGSKALLKKAVNEIYPAIIKTCQRHILKFYRQIKRFVIKIFKREKLDDIKSLKDEENDNIGELEKSQSVMNLAAELNLYLAQSSGDPFLQMKEKLRAEIDKWRVPPGNFPVK